MVVAGRPYRCGPRPPPPAARSWAGSPRGTGDGRAGSGRRRPPRIPRGAATGSPPPPAPCPGRLEEHRPRRLRVARAPRKVVEDLGQGSLQETVGVVRLSLRVAEEREPIAAPGGHRRGALRLGLADRHHRGPGLGVGVQLVAERLPALHQAGAAEMAHEDDERWAVGPELRQSTIPTQCLRQLKIGRGIARLGGQLVVPDPGRPLPYQPSTHRSSAACSSSSRLGSAIRRSARRCGEAYPVVSGRGPRGRRGCTTIVVLVTVVVVVLPVFVGVHPRGVGDADQKPLRAQEAR